MPRNDMIDRHPEYFDQLRDIYTAMDEAYNVVAAQYGFTCDDCPDNCCLTRFYNLTYLEYYYLMDGVGRLSGDRQRQVGQNARDVVDLVARDEAAGRTPRHMCPLNVDGRCGLHSHRLIICRLHGVPHELRYPDGRVTYGQGCPVFSSRFKDVDYIPFDRTPVYRRMSALEQEFRQAAGLSGKIKMTIAEMIVHGVEDRPL